MNEKKIGNLIIHLKFLNYIPEVYLNAIMMSKNYNSLYLGNILEVTVLQSRKTDH